MQAPHVEQTQEPGTRPDSQPLHARRQDTPSTRTNKQPNTRRLTVAWAADRRVRHRPCRCADRRCPPCTSEPCGPPVHGGMHRAAREYTTFTQHARNTKRVPGSARHATGTQQARCNTRSIRDATRTATSSCSQKARSDVAPVPLSTESQLHPFPLTMTSSRSQKHSSS